MAFGIYDPSKVIVTINGVIISGWSDGDAITITQDEQDFTRTVGMTGEVTRARSNDRSATVELELMSTALSNTFLTGLRNLDLNTGLGVFSLQIQDLLSGSVYTAAQAWITKSPDVAYGKEVGTRTWTIECGEMQMSTIGYGI